MLIQTNLSKSKALNYRRFFRRSWFGESQIFVNFWKVSGKPAKSYFRGHSIKIKEYRKKRLGYPGRKSCERETGEGRREKRSEQGNRTGKEKRKGILFIYISSS